jgi:hypothetical protein
MFPPEILDYIFSFLDGNLSSLKSCFDADPLFSYVVERHLYAHITVYNGHSDEPHTFHYSELSKFLSHNPHVGKYVRSLRIDVASGERGWDIELASILPILQQLETITLDSQDRADLMWGDLHESFQNAFIDCLTPSLKDIHITGIKDFPLFVLDKCENLKRLSFQELFYSTPWTEPYSPCHRLEHLSIKSWYRSSWAFSGIKLPNLRSFVFQPVMSGDFRFLSSHLHAWSTTLTTLELELRNYFQTPYYLSTKREERTPQTVIPFTLSSLPRLQRLIIRANVCAPNNSEPNKCCRSALPSITRLATTAPSLKQLTICINLSLTDNSPPPSLLWSPLITPDNSPFQTRVFIKAVVQKPESTMKELPFQDIISSFNANPKLMKKIEQGGLVVQEGDFADEF